MQAARSTLKMMGKRYYRRTAALRKLTDCIITGTTKSCPSTPSCYLQQQPQIIGSNEQLYNSLGGNFS